MKLAINKEKIVYLYCWKTGLAEFGNKVPEGAIEIDSRTKADIDKEKAAYNLAYKDWNSDPVKNKLPPQPWKIRMQTRMRLTKDGKKFLIPGIPESFTDKERIDALQHFISWAVKDEKVLPRASFN